MKKILNHLATDWYKYLLELIVITAGVLGAFALNNWNENRKQHLERLDFILNLKSELQLDTAALKERMNSHQEINTRLAKTKVLLYSDLPISKEENNLISSSVTSIEILTTVYKNIEKNNLLIASGILEGVSPELNNRYQLYLEQTQSNNAIVNKLGEQLQRVVLKDVNPLVDLDYSLEKTTSFNIKELRNSRGFKNALNRSIYYRQVHIGYSQEQIKQASALLELISEIKGI